VFHLTDGPGRGLKDVWRLLLEDGYRVANCAGMNSAGICDAGSFYLPDPWCNSEQPHPPELQAYQRLVLAMVQENSNTAGRLSLKTCGDFLRFWATHGASADTLAAIFRQLLAEAGDRRQSWRRAALLDKFQFDIFAHYWLRLRPDFASFFINSTAHYQHAYFHLLKPHAFPALRSAASADALHRDAVLFGYREMDRLLGRFFALEERGAMLVFATALSQQPNARAGSAYYRPRDIDALLSGIGVRPRRLLPVMAQQYSAEFPDQASAEAAAARIKTILYAGAPVFDVSSEAPNTLFFGAGLHAEAPAAALLEFAGSEPRSVPFYNVFYRIPHTKSGAHHPESALWFKTHDFQVNSEKVSILDIFPTLLDYYGVAAPEEGGMSRRGASLLPRLGIGRYRAMAKPAVSAPRVGAAEPAI
jgi:hypothetical protein